MVNSLIGEMNFTEIVNGLPIKFMRWPKSDQEGLWQAILGKINDGEMDITNLIAYARQWVALYPIVKESIHRLLKNRSTELF
jgi:hypothetical protein